MTKEELEKLQKRAESGDAEAQNELGDLYYDGDTVEENLEEAVKWYRKAAEQGNADGQYSLGWCYHHGEGVDKKSSEAVKWYRKAADQGHRGGQYGLGYCYIHFEGVESTANTMKEGLRLLELAAEQGSSNAQYELGRYYFDAKKQDLYQAAHYLKKAAADDHEDAKRYLNVLVDVYGTKYLEGKKTSKTKKSDAEDGTLPAKRKAEKYVPNSPQALAWLSEFEALPTVSAQIEKGPAILTRVLHENPHCYSAHCYLGETMFLKGNVIVAMEHFEKAKKSIEMNVPSIEVDIHKARLKKRLVFFFTHAMKQNGLCYESCLKKLVKLTKQEWVAIADEVIDSMMEDIGAWEAETLAKCRNTLLESIKATGERDASNVKRYMQLIVIEKILSRKVVGTKTSYNYSVDRNETSNVYYYDEHDKNMASAKTRIEEYRLALQILSPEAYEEFVQRERREEKEKRNKDRNKKRRRRFLYVALAIAALLLFYGYEIYTAW